MEFIHRNLRLLGLSLIMNSLNTDYEYCVFVKPVTDEQVFHDKFLCDKFCLLVCTRNFDNFFYDKCTCSKASMLAFEQVYLS